MALTIAFLGTAGAVIDGFDPIWWLVVIGGLATSALVLPMHTSDRAPSRQRHRAAAARSSSAPTPVGGSACRVSG